MNQSNNNHHYDENVRADKLRLLYNQPLPAVMFVVLAAILYANILWEQADKHLLYIWLSVIAFSSILRIVLFVTYSNKKPIGNDVLKWEKPYFITLMISSVAWGFGPTLLSYDLSFLYQTITCFMLVGIAGSALSTYSAIRYVAVSALLVILLPTILFFLFSGENIKILVAAATLLFMMAGIRSSRINSNALHYSFMLTHALSRAKEEAEKLASIDMLTGINNRRAFTELAKAQVEYCKRHEHPVSAIIIDADHFKDINDTYGHASGDAALQHLSEIIQNLTRASDIIGRIGGEEFAVLLTSTNVKDATVVAEKLKNWIADNPVHIAEEYFSMTVSVGVASDDNYDLEPLLSNADKAMYKAKEAGRNQVVCFESLN